jgi:hypothetical protein
MLITCQEPSVGTNGGSNVSIETEAEETWSRGDDVNLIRESQGNHEVCRLTRLN